jgi:predicted transcriptional regulator
MFEPANPPVFSSTDPFKWELLTGFSYDGDRVKTAIDWLSDQDPETWHIYIHAYNWDMGLDVPSWIAGQKMCDEATALYMYFVVTESEGYVFGPSQFTKSKKLAESIATRFKAKGYPRRKIQSKIVDRALQIHKRDYAQAVRLHGQPYWAIAPHKSLANPTGEVAVAAYQFSEGLPCYRRVARVPGTPAVPVSEAIGEETATCLECGISANVGLKRHISMDHKLSVEDYCLKWGLAPGTQLVSHAYRRKRLELFKKLKR